MKAVILCAGVGTRLLPRTQFVPKTLIPVCDRPILDYQFEALDGEVDEIILATGYLGEHVRDFAGDRATFVHNDRFATTNSMYTLWLARDHVAGEPFLLLNGDVLYDRLTLRQLLAHHAPTALLVDEHVELIEGEMNVVTRGGLVVEIGKEIPLSRATGQSLQMIKFGGHDSDLLFARMEVLINEGDTNRFPTFAYEAVVRQSSIAAVQRSGGTWFEIDNQADLAHCEESLRLSESMSR